MPRRRANQWNISWGIGRRSLTEACAESLEQRTLLSTIDWINRGMASDRFTEVFGADANLARSVIDAAIDRWERVITDFNYSDGTNTYTLQVALRASGEGHGGVGGPDNDISGKPSEGTIFFDRGDDETGDGNGDGAGWFLDPTPMDDVEFNGTIDNAFSGRAPNTSDAFGMSDLLTVAMHEMGHAFGMYSNPTMNGLATDTNMADPQGGGATYWVFEGPSVSHLFTSYDSSGGGTDTNGVQHSARTTQIFFDGMNWNGTVDMMNAFYSTSQRKLINNVSAWVMHDAWDVDISLPELFGTFYSMLDETTGELLVRAPATQAGSDDSIEMGAFGPNAYVVSVDIGEDVAGTGPFPGAGNLDAFVTFYDPDVISSIVVQPNNGDDSVTINTLPNGVGASIETGDGDDTVELGNGDLDTNLNGPITYNGGAGTDSLVLNDTTDGAGSDTYTFSTTALTKPVGDTISWAVIEAITLNASPNNDTITVNGTLPTTALRVNGRDGNDTINIQGTDLFSAVTVTTGNGSDTVNVNTDDTGIALALFPATELTSTINIGIGGRLALLTAPVANTRVIVTSTLTIDNGGALDLGNGSLVLDYVLISPYATVNNWIVSARNGGAWNGSGITSFAAFLANPANTTLGILTSAQYFNIYGNGTQFAGQTIDNTAILVKYTYYGDTDFNGKVDGADYARTDGTFNQQATMGNIGGWLNGDFDGNGKVDGSDYALIDAAFNSQTVVLRPAVR